MALKILNYYDFKLCVTDYANLFPKKIENLDITNSIISFISCYNMVFIQHNKDILKHLFSFFGNETLVVYVDLYFIKCNFFNLFVGLLKYANFGGVYL